MEIEGLHSNVRDLSNYKAGYPKKSAVGRYKKKGGFE